MAEKATASDRPPSPGTLSIVRTRSRVALCDDIRLLERARAARASEVASIADLKVVSRDTHDECPVCLSAYAEQRFPRARRPRDGFACSHSICYDCSLRLLMSVGQYRCPLCRANGTAVADAWAPTWLREQMALPAVIAAREEAVRALERSAPAAIRRAAMTAQQQIAALMRLMDGDADFERVREAVREASEVAVQVHGAEEGAEGQETYFDGAWVRRGIGTGLTSDELHRQLQEEMAAEAALRGGATDATSSGLETAEDDDDDDDDDDEWNGALQAAEAARPRMEAFMQAVASAYFGPPPPNASRISSPSPLSVAASDEEWPEVDLQHDHHHHQQQQQQQHEAPPGARVPDEDPASERLLVDAAGDDFDNPA